MDIKIIFSRYVLLTNQNNQVKIDCKFDTNT